MGLRLKKSCILIIAIVLTLTGMIDRGLCGSSQYGESGIVELQTVETIRKGEFIFGLWPQYLSSDGLNTYHVSPMSWELGITDRLETGLSLSRVVDTDPTQHGEGVDTRINLKYFIRKEQKFIPAVALSGFADGLLSNAGFGLRGVAQKVMLHFRTSINIGGYFPGREGKNYGNEVTYGLGVQYRGTKDLDLFFEASGRNVKKLNQGKAFWRIIPGIRYFLPYNFTLTIGLGVGLNSAIPEWEARVGLQMASYDERKEYRARYFVKKEVKPPPVEEKEDKERIFKTPVPKFKLKITG